MQSKSGRSDAYHTQGVYFGIFQSSFSTAIKENSNIKTIDKTTSSSLIGKALDQQKRNISMIPATDDELKMLNTIRHASCRDGLCNAEPAFFTFSCGACSTAEIHHL